MFQKNTAVTGFVIGVFISTSDGSEATTGTPVCTRVVDGTAGTCANAASYDATAGVWKINLASADLNGDVIGLKFALTDCQSITFTIKTVDDAVAALIGPAILDFADGVETDYTVRQALRLMAAILVGKVSGAGGEAEVFRSLDDTVNRVTVYPDTTGNRIEVIHSP
jgi:hypothetical protein